MSGRARAQAGAYTGVEGRPGRVQNVERGGGARGRTTFCTA
jgi:hypothetical protein